MYHTTALIQLENMLTTEYRNIINDAIKYELSYNLGKARNVLFIVICKDLYREWKSRRFKYESFHAIKSGIVVVNIADQRN